MLLHRLALEVYLAAKIGLPNPLQLPPGLMVLHAPACIARSCIEPSHQRTGTAKDNAQDAIIAGTSNRGERNAHSKLSRNDVRRIRAASRATGTRLELARMFHVHPDHITAIRARRFWRWLDERVAA